MALENEKIENDSVESSGLQKDKNSKPPYYNLLKRVFKGWNLFEVIFLALSITAITICFAVGEDKNPLSYIGSLIGVTSVLMIAKGLISAQFLSIAYCALYITVSIMQKYYGEAIIYAAIMLPLSIFTIFSWYKHRSSENKAVVKINKIHGMEYLYVVLAAIPLTVGFFFLLRALNTHQLIISTISLITSLVASYLELRRCSYYALGFMLNDIVLIVLWSLEMVSNGIGFLPTVISFCVFFVNDTYGLIHWKMQEKKQNLTENAEKIDKNAENT